MYYTTSSPIYNIYMVLWNIRKLMDWNGWFHLGHRLGKRTLRRLRSTQSQISLRIRAVWSGPTLLAIQLLSSLIAISSTITYSNPTVWVCRRVRRCNLCQRPKVPFLNWVPTCIPIPSMQRFNSPAARLAVKLSGDLSKLAEVGDSENVGAIWVGSNGVQPQSVHPQNPHLRQTPSHRGLSAFGLRPTWLTCYWTGRQWWQWRCSEHLHGPR